MILLAWASSFSNLYLWLGKEHLKNEEIVFCGKREHHDVVWT